MCTAVHECPDVAEQLLQVLDHFSAAPAAPEALYGRLSEVLRPWPQLLRDFAAFLTPSQARRCGLVGGTPLHPHTRRCTHAHAPAPLNSPWAFLSFKQLLEQQLFQRSRRFLWRLGRSLGQGSVLYHQVVSVLQGSSASTPEDLEKVEVNLHLMFQCSERVDKI